MIYDMRIYTANAGKERAMIDRFTGIVMPIFARLGIEVVTVYETREDAPRLAYITRFNDAGHRDAAWDAFKGDQEWAAAKAASETDGPLLMKQDILVMDQLPSVA